MSDTWAISRVLRRVPHSRTFETYYIHTYASCVSVCVCVCGVCMCGHMCHYMYVHVCAYVCGVCMCVCVCVCVGVCVCEWICVIMYMCVHTCVVCDVWCACVVCVCTCGLAHANLNGQSSLVNCSEKERKHCLQAWQAGGRGDRVFLGNSVRG